MTPETSVAAVNATAKPVVLNARATASVKSCFSTNSFINFYPDYKLNRYSYIFRTKMISHYKGFMTFLNDEKDLYQRLIKISKIKYSSISDIFFVLSIILLKFKC